METLDAKQKTGELEYDVNPLRFFNDYYSIPSPDRIQLLRALVDWVLQEGTVIRQGIEQDNKHYAVEPFGTDQSRRVYWYFGGKLCLNFLLDTEVGRSVFGPRTRVKTHR